MAFFDAALQLSNLQAITATAASTVIYDVTGAGSGNAPPMVFGQTATGGAILAGFDIGMGDGEVRPTLMMTVGTAFTTGNAATLTVQIQAAIDNGSNAPAAYTTIVETGAFSAAQLVAGATLLIPVPPTTIGEALPRFYRINYVVGTGVFSAGTVTSNILINPPSKLENTLFASNFFAA